MKHLRKFNENNQNMKKTKLNIIPSVDKNDIIHFIEQNSEYDSNQSFDIFSKELTHIQYNLPDEIESYWFESVEDEYRISKVIVDKLKYDGWIKKFTDVQEISQDYYILFTDLEVDI
jgi:hypothetical protein